MEVKTEPERLKEWYTNLIKMFREEYAKLSDEEKKHVSAMHDYHSRCQIEAFWLKQPEWQLIIKTRFEDRPDGEIIINGPYDSTVFLDETKKIINDQRWNRPLDHKDHRFLLPNSPRLYSELLAQNLHRFIEKAKNAFFTKWHVVRGLSDSIIFGDDVIIEHYFGNMAKDIDYRFLVEKIIQDTKKQAEYVNKSQNQQDIPKSQQAETPKGFGAYFFPPIVIGKIQQSSPSDILEGRTGIGFPTFDKKAFDIQFMQTPVIITKDGYVGVCSNSKKESLEILNTIMATCTLDGVEAYAVREHELSQIDYNSETLAITGYGYDMKTIRNQLFQGMHGDKILEYRIKEIPEDRIKNTIKNASNIFRNKLFSEEIRILLESITHLKGSEFAQAFMMGWIIIERHVSESWRKKINEKNLDVKRMNKLFQRSTDSILEDLSLNGDLGETEYDTFMEMKDKRNGFIHKGKQIAKEDAEKCLNVAKEIILNKMSAIIKN